MKRQAIFCFLLQLISELSSGSHITVLPGSTVELPCLASQTALPGAAITWKHNGKDVSPDVLSHGMAKVKKDRWYLSISPVTAASEGVYVCSIQTDNMEITGRYQVTVGALVYNITMHVLEGSNIELPCHLHSTMQVQTNGIWFKDMGGGKRTQLNREDGGGANDPRLELLYPFDQDQTLIIRNTVMEDAGTYRCESPERVELTTVHLFVKAGPTPAPPSCSGFTSAWEPCQDENSRTGGPMLKESMTEFSFKVFSYLRESNPSGNLLFSPISINGVLSHLLLGARGDTRKAIQTAVCVPHDFHCVHFQMKKLREKLANSLQVASQIYYNPEITLSESFTDQSMQFYEAEPIRLLETSEENARMINSWVANKTNNKIKELVDEVPPHSQLILLNAVSYSGQWKVKFNQKSKKEVFSKLNGDLKHVPVLYESQYMTSMADVVALKAKVARFALSGNSSLYILLPRFNRQTDLQQVEDRMTDGVVRQMIQQLKATYPRPIEVTLPKINMDSQPDMTILLKKLGLSSLFEEANLCGLYSDNTIVLNDARHKAFLSLTEQGVEAAGASSMAFSRSFDSFSALRPFILLLWSDLADVPLFIGRVTEP